ncbi:MAG: DUF1385 domain-containing protein [Nanoarchaeota archaeon]|nr:DUF1385 domain-containing protein [Nanoarchaeota archaeon]MBU1597502.1 DUF1385 domain-containing protein [Nanoarchaeota archaeon]MBU2442171.1 DUF1385 domain-containing protein [Nanoarchaeota archaeon]
MHKKNKKSKPELMVGGQAVIEGVLMRTGDDYAIAVRKANGKIIVKKQKHASLTKKNKFFGWPFVRGIIVLYETLVLGYKALTFSANESLEEEKPKKKTSKKKDKKPEIGSFELIFTLVLSIIFALALFKFLPLGIATLLKNKIGGSNILFNVIDGVVKFIVFIAYILIISLLKDVKRVFQYHGAEHKTVYCYENNKKLTVANVKKFSKAHPRCGTTFIMVVLFLSILFYLLIPFNMNFWLKLMVRILFLPIIAGISYEFIKITGKYHHTPIGRILSAPGLLVQGLTTKEPDDKQIEVAIKSLSAVVK